MKKINISVVVLTLIIVVFSSSLAFYAAKIMGSPKGIDVIAKNVSIKLTNGGLIGDAVIKPGWSKTNTFTITNNSKGNFRYNIIIKDYFNNFETVGNLQYKITSSTGYNMADFEELPKSTENRDLILAYNVNIDKDTTQNYTVEIKYINSEEDQSADMGKTLGGTLYITENTNKIVTYNTNSIGSKLLSDNTTRLTRASFDSVYTKTNTNTLFTSTEDDALVYYFAGDAKNNWVKFGTWNEDKTVVIGRTSWDSAGLFGKSYSSMSECTSASDFNLNCTTVELAKKGDPMYWRIVRTNTDGSLKLLYAGTSVTSETAYIGMNVFNSNANNPMYVGYMYGTSGSLENNRTNTNDSYVKTLIDSWYKTNLVPYENYISNEAVYCNDRSVTSGSYELGTNFFYGAYTRLKTNKTPTYNCSAKEDKFSVSNATGNGKLTYPIALMTADEYAYAGGNKEMSLNSPYAYYYSNSLGKSSVGKSVWWLMSPYLNVAVNNIDYAGVNTGTGYYTNSEGNLGYNDPTYSNAIRPVISINADVVYKSGDGSSASPYEIEATAKQLTLYTKLLEDKTEKKTRTDFSTTFTTENTKTLYTSTENGKTVYYFAGNPSDNWIKFGKTNAGTCKINSKNVKLYSNGKFIPLDASSCNNEIPSNFYFCDVGDSDNLFTAVFINYADASICYDGSYMNGALSDIKTTANVTDIYWRIIRTNSDGSIRLLYHGTSTNSTNAYIAETVYNELYDNSMYVGYMYGTSGSLPNNRTNTNSSTIKSVIDTWYKNNLKTNYGKYLSDTAVYCNDREIGSGEYSVNGSIFEFAASTRLNTNKTPTYDCKNSKDALSVSNNEAKLDYPVALMTADELSFAGAVYAANSSAWFYQNSSGGSSVGTAHYFTMTPSLWHGTYPRLFDMRGSETPGFMGHSYVHDTDIAVARPVTSLKSCVIYSYGDGSASNPYVIQETSSGC